jgi:hypothetical protein
MKTMYAIIYKEDNSIEAIVDSPKAFDEWFSRHNKEREDNGELPESKWEFDLLEAEFFKK